MIHPSCPELRFAVKVLRQAVALCRRVQTGMTSQGLTKSDFSPVTVADFSVQALVGHALAETFPEDVLVGEEDSSALRADSAMLDRVTHFAGTVIRGATDADVCAWIDRGADGTARRFWTLDPVDGTKGYLRGGQYAVALALIEDGEVILGLLGCPHLDAHGQPDKHGPGVLLAARRGKGAWSMTLMDGDDATQAVRVSACRDAAEARMLRSF
jgi:3'(2'), 5'-bisphosphate nucleotidase